MDTVGCRVAVIAVCHGALARDVVGVATAGIEHLAAAAADPRRDGHQVSTPLGVESGRVVARNGGHQGGAVCLAPALVGILDTYQARRQWNVSNKAKGEIPADGRKDAAEILGPDTAHGRYGGRRILRSDEAVDRQVGS